MRALKSAMTVFVVTTGCHGNPTPTHRDDAIIDASVDGNEVDANEGCQDFPRPEDPLCPTVRPFCCPATLETPWYCSELSENPNGLACREDPVGGTILSCSSVDGGGCPANQSVCCEENLSGQIITYCSDHAFRGVGWTCSQ
jgi:hypothetical protein